MKQAPYIEPQTGMCTKPSVRVPSQKAHTLTSSHPVHQTQQDALMTYIHHIKHAPCIERHKHAHQTQRKDTLMSTRMKTNTRY